MLLRAAMGDVRLTLSSIAYPIEPGSPSATTSCTPPFSPVSSPPVLTSSVAASAPAAKGAAPAARVAAKEGGGKEGGGKEGRRARDEPKHATAANGQPPVDADLVTSMLRKGDANAAAPTASRARGLAKALGELPAGSLKLTVTPTSSRTVEVTIALL